MKEFNYCLRCRRKLKNIKARQIGYGDVCLSKIQHFSKTPLFKTGGREEDGEAGIEAGN